MVADVLCEYIMPIIIAMAVFKEIIIILILLILLG